MKFIVKAAQYKDNVEANIEPKEIPQVITDLLNAGLNDNSSANQLNVNFVRSNIARLLQTIEANPIKSNTYDFQAKIGDLPLNFQVKGCSQAGQFVVSEIILDEASYTKEFTYKGIRQKRAEGLAAHVLNNYASPDNAQRFTLGNESTNVIKNDWANHVKAQRDLRNHPGKNNPKRAVVPYDYKNKQLVVVEKTKPAQDQILAQDQTKPAQGQTQQDTKQSTWSDWAHYAKDKLLQVLPHTLVAAGAFVFRNPIIAGLTSVASRIGLVAVSAFITPITVVAAAVGLSAAFVGAREWFKRSKAESYEAKTDVQLKELSADHVKAFLDGVEAQKSYTAQAKTCFSFNDYRHGNAFFAGMGAAAGNKNALIEKIKQSKPQA